MIPSIDCVFWHIHLNFEICVLVCTIILMLTHLVLSRSGSIINEIELTFSSTTSVPNNAEIGRVLETATLPTLNIVIGSITVREGENINIDYSVSPVGPFY